MRSADSMEGRDSVCRLVLGLIWVSRRAVRCCGFGRGMAPASDMPESDVYSRAAADTKRVTNGGGSPGPGARGRRRLPAVSLAASRRPSCVADEALTSAVQSRDHYCCLYCTRRQLCATICPTSCHCRRTIATCLCLPFM
jgi:hypothetical protein